jgi:acetyl esterase/lipase
LPLALPLLLPLALAAEGPITYAEPDHHPLTLDRWLPATPGPHPGVLLIHGGGWKYGDLYHGVSEQAAAAAGAGLVVVSPNYRLSTEARWPAQLDDVACALRWMKAHSAELDLDPARIAVVGHSAGGQLALMLAEAPELAPPGWCPSQADGEVQAAVSLAGPSDFSTFYADTIWWGRRMARELLGLRPSQVTPEALAQASPLRLVDASGPPVLQVVGGADPLVPGAVAASYDAALRRVGRASEIQTVPEAGHNDVNRVDLWLDWALGHLP